MLHSHVLHMAAACEHLCVTHDEDYVLHMMDKILEGIDRVCDT